MLRTEEPYAMSERRSSSDSNKASSGEVSPYDNNSPVLSERRGDPGSPGQYSLVGQVASWNRESGADAWGSKGELQSHFRFFFFNNQFCSNFLNPHDINSFRFFVFFFYFFYFQFVQKLSFGCVDARNVQPNILLFCLLQTLYQRTMQTFGGHGTLL